jgi:hypothetical protein
MSPLLPHLAATLKQARLDAGLSLRDMESYGRERSNLRKVEQGIAAEQKYWPNLDEYVAAYSEATGIAPHVLWGRAVKLMKS